MKAGPGVELVFEGPLHPLDVAVELGALGREDEERNVQALASFLKRCHELTTAVYLNRPDGEGGVGDEVGQEAGGQVGGGSGVHLGRGKAGGATSSREVLATVKASFLASVPPRLSAEGVRGFCLEFAFRCFETASFTPPNEIHEEGL